MAYKCCNYDNCKQEFADKDTRDRHEEFCTVPPPPPDPPERSDQDRRAS